MPILSVSAVIQCMEVLHRNARSALTRLLNAAFASVRLENGWIDLDSCWTPLVAFGRELEKHRGQWITATQVYPAVSSAVRKRMESVSGEGARLSGALSDILGADALLELQEQLLSYFESIPRVYTVCFPLPGTAPNRTLSYELTDKVTLQSFSKEDVPPRNGLLSVLNGVTSFEPQRYIYVLTSKVTD